MVRDGGLALGHRKSQTQTSPSGEAARIMSTRSRTGSASALNPLASSVASAVPSGAASTDAQHSVGRAFVVAAGLLTGHLFN